MVLKDLLKYVKKTLDHQVPKKQKFVHGNHLPFYEEKAIMQRTRFRNKYLKNKTDENKRKYAK